MKDSDCGTAARTEQKVAQFDIHLSEAEWQALVDAVESQLRIPSGSRHGDKNLALAFADAKLDLVELDPNVVVDGETKGLEDVAEELPEDATPESLDETAGGTSRRS